MKADMRLAAVLALMVLALGSAGLSPAVSAAPPAPATAYDCAAASGISQPDCSALVALYNSTNGPGWSTQTGWLTTGTPCAWFGVSCAGNRVTSLQLTSNHLSGTLPSELGNLTGLQVLFLDSNQLQGPVPSSLGNLTNLTVLLLGFNGLSGGLPSELGSLSGLQFLDISSNQLTGPIPPQFGSLVSLQQLSLRDNQLSGMVPAELGNIAGLGTLQIDANPQLSRNLPQALRKLALTGFWFDGTELCEPKDSGFQAWLTGIGGGEVGTASLCEAQATLVAISRAANDAVLNWTDEAPDTSYDVYVGATPYFIVGAAAPAASLPQPSATWSDAGALATPGSGFYVVRSRFQDSYQGVLTNDLFSDSNRTGRFSFQLMAGG